MEIHVFRSAEATKLPTQSMQPPFLAILYLSLQDGK